MEKLEHEHLIRCKMAKTFALVDYVRQSTANKSPKYGEYGTFELSCPIIF